MLIVYFLLSVACILTDDAPGETSVIPAPILKHSISQSNYVDKQLCVSAIVEPAATHSTTPNKLDAVVRCVYVLKYPPRVLPMCVCSCVRARVCTGVMYSNH